jgi:hypothetical protein
MRELFRVVLIGKHFPESLPDVVPHRASRESNRDFKVSLPRSHVLARNYID